VTRNKPVISLYSPAKNINRHQHMCFGCWCAS